MPHLDREHPPDKVVLSYQDCASSGTIAVSKVQLQTSETTGSSMHHLLCTLYAVFTGVLESSLPSLNLSVSYNWVCIRIQGLDLLLLSARNSQVKLSALQSSQTFFQYILIDFSGHTFHDKVLILSLLYSTC